ncbi:MAG: hypothetical protein BRD49_00645, partial [Bacteroidetes bacterium SW_10_40_5]
MLAMSIILKRIFSSQIWAVFFLVALMIQGCSSQKDQSNSQETHKTPKNIILILGNGLGFDHLRALKQEKSSLTLTKFDVSGVMQPEAYDALIPDPAAASSALATGQLAQNNTIGLNRHGNPSQPLLQMAKNNGYTTGILSTNILNSPQLAPFYTNHQNFKAYGDHAKALLDAKVDVMIGQRSPGFKEHKVTRKFEERDYEIVEDAGKLGRKRDEKILAAVTTKNKKNGEWLQNAWESTFKSLSKSDKGYCLVISYEEMLAIGSNNNLDQVKQQVGDFDEFVKQIYSYTLNDSKTLVIVTGNYHKGGFVLNQLN